MMANLPAGDGKQRVTNRSLAEVSACEPNTFKTFSTRHQSSLLKLGLIAFKLLVWEKKGVQVPAE